MVSSVAVVDYVDNKDDGYDNDDEGYEFVEAEEPGEAILDQSRCVSPQKDISAKFGSILGNDDDAAIIANASLPVINGIQLSPAPDSNIVAMITDCTDTTGRTTTDGATTTCESTDESAVPNTAKDKEQQKQEQEEMSLDFNKATSVDPLLRISVLSKPGASAPILSTTSDYSGDMANGIDPSLDSLTLAGSAMERASAAASASASASASALIKFLNSPSASDTSNQIPKMDNPVQTLASIDDRNKRTRPRMIAKKTSLAVSPKVSDDNNNNKTNSSSNNKEEVIGAQKTTNEIIIQPESAKAAAPSTGGQLRYRKGKFTALFNDNSTVLNTTPGKDEVSHSSLSPSSTTFHQPTTGIHDIALRVQSSTTITPTTPFGTPVSLADAGNKRRRTPKMTKQSSMNPVELYEARCRVCELCLKSDCGKCASCVLNGIITNYGTLPRRVCLRKMCQSIPASLKAQPAIGFPPGWTFFFVRRGGKAQHDFVLSSPTNSYYYGFASALSRHQDLTQISDLKLRFFAYIGEPFNDTNINDVQPGTPTTSTRTATKKKDFHKKKKTASPALVRKAARKDRLSNVKEIDSRVYCKFSNGFYYWGIITNKRMDMGKVSYAVRFDDGDSLDNISDSDDVAEDGNIYTEFAYFTKVGEYPPPRPFSSSPSSSLLSTSPRPKRLKMKRIRTQTPEELFQNRCKACTCCTEPDCLRCTSCINNRNEASGDPQCCLRKMCIHIPLDVKKQGAPGLPKGWTFASVTGPKLTIFSPRGEEFHSIREALACRKKSTADADADMIEFEDHTGGSVLWRDNSHDLVGKQYCQEWTDVRGRNKIIFGYITACERDRCDVNYTSFIITYNEQSLKSVLKMRVIGDWDVQPTTKMSLEWALGGYLAYLSVLEASTSADQTTPPSRRWLIPQMRTATLVQGPCTKNLPRLTLVWKTFHLVFTVRQSTIPNAGLGVFVQCTSMIPSCSELRLKKGHMIDLGVYAPFRPEDFKEESVFLVKNFIFGLKCEEWAFDTGPTSSQFDITDDWTGELHDIAAQHIPAYVNECRIENHPTVHAEHDPEGVVHYLLGKSNEDCVVPADGSIMELFINYGPRYERVRIRKNYSFLPPDERIAQMQSVEQENIDYLEEIAWFQGTELRSCAEFLTRIVLGGTLSEEFHFNALCAAVGLRLRATTFDRHVKSIKNQNRSCFQNIDSPQPKANVHNDLHDVLAQYQHVVRILLKGTKQANLLGLEAAGDHVTMLSELISGVLKDTPSSRIQQLVSLFTAK